MSNIKLYRHALSGHSHRVQLFLSILGLDADIIDVDLMNGEHKQPEFLKKNPFGVVPVIEDGALTLVESTAILVYLAKTYDPARAWLPEDAAGAAAVERFLALAAGPIASGPGAARLVTVFNAGLDHEKAIATAHSLLKVFDAHLQDRDWLATDRPTIADLANYAYIAHAPEGNVSLQDYPNVRAWLNRVESLPGFIPMQATAAGMAA